MIYKTNLIQNLYPKNIEKGKVFFSFKRKSIQLIVKKYKD